MSETQPLLLLLKNFFPDSSSSSLRSRIKTGRVFVNGELQTHPNACFSVDSHLEVRALKEIFKRKVAGMPILYEDSRLIAIDKPAGLLSVPTPGKDHHALGLLKGRLANPHIFSVHRLDKGTSGVMIFAKGKASENYFDQIFENHDITREYIAIVSGRVEPDEGKLTGFVREKSLYEMSISNFPNGGKIAVSYFKVLKRSDNFSYLLFSLETGRKHQIRLQCREMGHPIIGDSLYGSDTSPIRRIGLHAHRLSFIHPFNKRLMDLYSPVPYLFMRLGCPDKFENANFKKNSVK